MRISYATSIAVALAIMAAAPPARAVDLLTNGNLEALVSPPGWALETSITGLPGAPVNATETVTFANSTNDTPMSGPALGVLLRPFSGNAGIYAGQNRKTNALLTQTVAANPNRTYTLTGDHFIGEGFSGAVNNLDVLSPSDGNKPADFNIDLDVDGTDLLTWQRGNGLDIGAVKADGDAEGDGKVNGVDLASWEATYGYGLPTGTYQSPTLAKFEMQFLTAADVPTGAPITLNLKTALVPGGWQTRTLGGPTVGLSPANAAKVRITASAIDMTDNAGDQTASFDNFRLQRDGDGASVNRLVNGNLNEAGGPLGWTVVEVPDGSENTTGYRDFANNTLGGQQGLWLRSFAGGDGTMSQVVNAVAGGSYSFKAWSKWETGYSGDALTFPGTTTKTYMTMEFLNGSDVLIGSAAQLELDAAGQISDLVWRQFTLNAMAPAGTAKVRVSVSGIDMFNSGIDPQGAFFDDLTLELGGAFAAVPEPSTAVGAAIFGDVRRRSVAAPTAKQLANNRARDKGWSLAIRRPSVQNSISPTAVASGARRTLKSRRSSADEYEKRPFEVHTSLFRGIGRLCHRLDRPPGLRRRRFLWRSE